MGGRGERKVKSGRERGEEGEEWEVRSGRERGEESEEWEGYRGC